MWFDSDFSFSKHVQNVCKSCFIQLRDFRNIRQFLTHDAAVSVANAFVSSQLNYCNSLFRSLSKFTDYSLSKIVQPELLQIRVNILGQLRYSGNSIGSLFSFAQSSNWLPWCTSLFILASLNILLHIYPHTTILTILDVVRVLPISFFV